MNSFALFLVLACATSAYGQAGAPCHNTVFSFTPRHALNLTLFSGSWYAHEYASSFINNTPKPDYKCLRIDFEQESELQLAIKESYNNITTGALVEQIGSIAVNNTRSPFSSLWTYTSDDVSWTTDMILLGSDLTFSRWAVIYGCSIRPPNAFRQETVTVFTRSHDVGDDLRQFLKALMVGTGFRIGDHWPIDQTECQN